MEKSLFTVLVQNAIASSVFSLIISNLSKDLSLHSIKNVDNMEKEGQQMILSIQNVLKTLNEKIEELDSINNQACFIIN